MQNLGAKLEPLITTKEIPQKKIHKDKISYTGNDIWVSKTDLAQFEKNIIKTAGEYVYPTVFTSIGNESSPTTHPIINDLSLYRLRVWANIYRIKHSTNTIAYNEYYIYKLYTRTLKILNT